MISVIIPVETAAPHLVRALTPLVSGVAEGLVKDVLIVGPPGAEEPHAIAEEAGCTFIFASGDAAARLTSAVETARGGYLLFLPPNVALAPGWTSEARALIERGAARAAAFRYALASDEAAARRRESWINFMAALSKRPRSEQGLLLPRRLLESVGGLRTATDPIADLAARIGGARLAFFRTEAVAQS